MFQNSSDVGSYIWLSFPNHPKFQTVNTISVQFASTNIIIRKWFLIRSMVSASLRERVMPPVLKGAVVHLFLKEDVPLSWIQWISIVLSLFREGHGESGCAAAVKKPEGSRLFQPASVRLVFCVETTLDVIINDLWQVVGWRWSIHPCVSYCWLSRTLIMLFFWTSSGC